MNRINLYETLSLVIGIHLRFTLFFIYGFGCLMGLYIATWCTAFILGMGLSELIIEAEKNKELAATFLIFSFTGLYLAAPKVVNILERHCIIFIKSRR